MPKRVEIKISDQKLFYTTDELKTLGLSNYLIKKLVTEGQLKKINGSTYENLKYTQETSDFYYTHAYAPNGVICLMSAARFYQLTNDWPSTVHIAMKRNYRISTMPEWPNIEISHFSKDRYETGIVEVIEGENSFKIYDK